MTIEETELIKQAIHTHKSMLYRDINEYSKQGNTEAIKDCYSEIHKYEELEKKL